MDTVADQRDPRLGELFVALVEAPDSTTAVTIEAAIWQIWLDGGDASLNELMVQGIEAMNARRFRDAVGRFTALIDSAPAFAEAWNKRATVYYLMDRFEDSVRDIERTLALEPRHFGAISGMGLIFLQRGDEEGALGAFEKVLEIIRTRGAPDSTWSGCANGGRASESEGVRTSVQGMNYPGGLGLNYASRPGEEAIVPDRARMRSAFPGAGAAGPESSYRE